MKKIDALLVSMSGELDQNNDNGSIRAGINLYMEPIAEASREEVQSNANHMVNDDDDQMRPGREEVYPLSNIINEIDILFDNNSEEEGKERQDGRLGRYPGS